MDLKVLWDGKEVSVKLKKMTDLEKIEYYDSIFDKNQQPVKNAVEIVMELLKRTVASAPFSISREDLNKFGDGELMRLIEESKKLCGLEDKKKD